MEEHMMEWIIEHVAEPEWIITANRMLSIVRDYPELVNDRTWPEIRTLAERV